MEAKENKKVLKAVLILLISIAITPLIIEYEKAAAQTVQQLRLAGDERIELPPKVLETPIIPFDQSPIMSSDT